VLEVLLLKAELRQAALLAENLLALAEDPLLLIELSAVLLASLLLARNLTLS
jgi:hypothetical protein